MIMADISDEMECQKMLIADGHHRYETALNYSRENPDDERKASYWPPWWPAMMTGWSYGPLTG